MLVRLALLALSALPVQASDERANAPDRVELTDGSVLEGRVVLDAGTRIVLRVGAKARTLERAKVKSVRSAEGSLRELLSQWERVPPDDAGAVLDLARFADARGLAGERELFALLALTLAPDLAPAHELLGHEKKGDDWSVRDGSRRVPWKKLAAVRREFEHGWDLVSTHYALRTNLTLPVACQILLELELFHRQYRDLLAQPLEIAESSARLTVAAHADQQSFPEATGGGTGWFSSSTGNAALLFLGELEPVRLLEVATLQLDWAASGAMPNAHPLPDWVDTGLSLLLASARTGAPGRPSFDEGLFLPELVRVHATAKKPYDLGRVTGFTAEDLAGTSHSDLKYAQCYTLAHFLWYGEGGAAREGFLRYLALAFAGKATSSSLERALERKERELEQAWTAHVQALKRP